MSGLTVANLRLYSQQQADMQASQFVADSEWLNWLNEAGAELHDLIVRADPSYFRSTTTIAVLANTETYSLAALSPAYYQTLAVYWLENGKRLPMSRLQLHDLDPDYTQDERVLYTPQRPYGYDVLGSNLFLTPKPTTTGSIDFWYIPQFVRKTLDADTFDYPIINGWERFLVVATAIKALIKEESDITALLQEKSQLEARIAAMAEQKDQFSARQMRDVYGTMRRGRRY